MEKKRKARFTVIRGDVWPYDILVCLGATKDEILRYCETKFENALTEADKDKLESSKGLGFTLMLENRATILWLKKYPTTPQGFGVLAHEIFHVADVILWKAGLKLSEDSDEAWAYLIDWITREIYSRYRLAQRG